MTTLLRDDEYDIEISYDPYPTSPIYYRVMTFDDPEWQHSGLQCADVVGGYQRDECVIAAVRGVVDAA